jgi:hypothetical protein
LSDEIEKESIAFSIFLKMFHLPRNLFKIIPDIMFCHLLNFSEIYNRIAGMGFNFSFQIPGKEIKPIVYLLAKGDFHLG